MSKRHSSMPPSGRGVSRRRFVQSSLAMGAPLLGVSAQAAVSSRLEAYASATSVAQGGTIDFHARDPKGALFGGKSVDLIITRMGSPDQVMLRTTALVYYRFVPANASTNGCNWARTYRLSVPSTWPSGAYWATFGAGATPCSAPFVVRPAQRGVGTRVMVQIPVTTAQAYNNYGGRSLYEYNSTRGVRATRVSFDRPLGDSISPSFDGWMPVLVRWLEAKGIVADYCTSLDMHTNSALLKGYQLVVLAGHDEYWSLDMRNHLDQFVAAGGNAAILGGNTCWWQVRFEAGRAANRTMVCYKDVIADPGSDPKRLTTTWTTLPRPYPTNASLGLSSTGGAAWSGGDRPDTPFVVQRPEHWVFEGLNFSQNSAFGGAYVGYETDTASFCRGRDNRAYPTGEDDAPAALKILAVADATDWNTKSLAMGGSGAASGRAAIGVFSRGGGQGTVFNGGVIDWVYGLKPELYRQESTPISVITLNVIRKLSGTWSESIEVRQCMSTPAAGAPVYYYTMGTEVPEGMMLTKTAFLALAAPAAGTMPVYRLSSLADGTAARCRYQHTMDPNALIAQGWKIDALAFHAYVDDAAGRQAIFQCHWQDADGGLVTCLLADPVQAPEGWTLGGTAFYVPVA